MIKKSIYIFVLLFVVSLIIYLTDAQRYNYSKPELVKTELIPIYATDTIQHTQMHKFICLYKSKLDKSMNQVIGFAPETMEPKQPESELSNLIADIMLEEARKTEPSTAACVANMGGFRATLYQGNITIGNIFSILPFENTLVILKLKGSDIIELADIIAMRGGEAVSGITLHINGKGSADNLLLQGEKVDPEKEYYITTNDYLSFGNDQMTPLANYSEIIKPGTTIRDIMLNYITKETANGREIKGKKDGRITK